MNTPGPQPLAYGETPETAVKQVKRAVGPFAFTALLIWKVGRVVLVFIGKAAVLFKIPLLGTVLSASLSIGAYALLYGFPFAIGLVGSLMVHELGHVVQLRREGMPVKALNFVPFLGAYVLSDGARSADQQARISIAGPIAGTLLAGALLLIANGDPLLEAIAFTGFFLNLINLLPVPMLDGGGVGTLFSTGWWLLIAAVSGGIALASGTGFALLIAGGALVVAYSRRAGGLALHPRDGVPPRERTRAAALYLGVVAVCAFGMAVTYLDRSDELVDHYDTGAAPGFVANAR